MHRVTKATQGGGRKEKPHRELYRWRRAAQVRKCCSCLKQTENQSVWFTKTSGTVCGLWHFLKVGLFKYCIFYFHE